MKLWDKTKIYFTSNKETFAKGICFDKLFLIFVIGSIFGTIYEQILELVTVYYETGEIVWVSRTAVIYGPFNIIYGVGAVLFILLLGRKERPWWQVLLYGALIGGIFEYGVGFLQETFVGMVSWDYSDRFLNINGRTTIPYMLFWGFLSVFLIKVIYPFLSNLIEKIPYNLGNLVTNILVIFLSLDMLVSWTALIRQNLRRNGVEPLTFIGEFYDKVYTDEFLEKIYPNMVASD